MSAIIDVVRIVFREIDARGGRNPDYAAIEPTLYAELMDELSREPWIKDHGIRAAAWCDQPDVLICGVPVIPEPQKP